MKKSFVILHLCTAMICVMLCSCSSKEKEEEFFLKNFCQLKLFPDAYRKCEQLLKGGAE